MDLFCFQGGLHSKAASAAGWAQIPWSLIRGRIVITTPGRSVFHFKTFPEQILLDEYCSDAAGLDVYYRSSRINKLTRPAVPTHCLHGNFFFFTCLHQELPLLQLPSLNCLSHPPGYLVKTRIKRIAFKNPLSGRKSGLSELRQKYGPSDEVRRLMGRQPTFTTWCSAKVRFRVTRYAIRQVF